MKTRNVHTRDRREDRLQREEKLGTPSETLPGKTRRDREAYAHFDPTQSPRSKRQGGARPARRRKDDESETRSPICFRLNAPSAASVFVAGTFNDWSPAEAALVREVSGDWRAEIHLAPGKYEYRFVVDGVWQEDPKASHSAANPFGGNNSILIVS